MQSIPPVLDPAAARGLHALDVLTAARELRRRARAAILAGNLGPPATTRTPAHVTLAATTLLPALRTARLLGRARELPTCWNCGAVLLPKHVHWVDEEWGYSPACADCAGEIDSLRRS